MVNFKPWLSQTKNIFMLIHSLSSACSFLNSGWKTNNRKAELIYMDSSFSPPKALCTGILHRFVLWVAEWDLHEPSLLSILHKCSTGSSRKFENWVTGLVVLNCFETFLWYDVESVVLMLYCSWLMCVSSSHHSHQVCSVILKINAFFFLARSSWTPCTSTSPGYT